MSCFRFHCDNVAKHKADKRKGPGITSMSCKMQNYSMLLYITNSFIHQPSSSGKQNACFRELENWKNGLCSLCNWIKLHIRHLVLWFLFSCFFVKCELLPFFLYILLYFLAAINNPLFLQWSLERAEFAVFCLQSPIFFQVSGINLCRYFQGQKNGQDNHQTSSLCLVICLGYENPLCKWPIITFQNRTSDAQLYSCKYIKKTSIEDSFT